MSFRREIKATLNKGKLSTLTKWIFDNRGKILYPERLINSIYFDTRNLNMYTESMEGILPRKKIRLRTYFSSNSFDKLQDKSSLEYKISSVEGRFKISKKKFKKININSSTGMRDKDYGFCQPILNVVYLRSYYIIKNVRLTIDKSITYKKVKLLKISPFPIRDNLNVVEIKYSNSELDNEIINSFPFQFNRFSKYCRGIEFTQKKYCDENV